MNDSPRSLVASTLLAVNFKFVTVIRSILRTFRVVLDTDLTPQTADISIIDVPFLLFLNTRMYGSKINWTKLSFATGVNLVTFSLALTMRKAH